MCFFCLVVTYAVWQAPSVTETWDSTYTSANSFRACWYSRNSASPNTWNSQNQTSKTSDDTTKLILNFFLSPITVTILKQLHAPQSRGGRCRSLRASGRWARSGCSWSVSASYATPAASSWSCVQWMHWDCDLSPAEEFLRSKQKEQTVKVKTNSP